MTTFGTSLLAKEIKFNKMGAERGARLVNFAPLQWAAGKRQQHHTVWAPTNACPAHPLCPSLHPSPSPSLASPSRRVIKILSENFAPLLGFLCCVCFFFMLGIKIHREWKMRKFSTAAVDVWKFSKATTTTVGNIWKFVCNFVYFCVFYLWLLICITTCNIFWPTRRLQLAKLASQFRPLCLIKQKNNPSRPDGPQCQSQQQKPQQNRRWKKARHATHFGNWLAARSIQTSNRNWNCLSKIHSYIYHI